MSVLLRTAVNGEVFWCRDKLQILRIVALKSSRELHSETSREVWVFTECLLSAPPSRVSKDIDVRRPKRQACESTVIPRKLRFVILRPTFIANHIGDMAHHIRVKASSQPDGLWKISSEAIACNSMKSFAPPLIVGNSQPRDRSGLVHGLRDLFLQ